jgi:hypothetical protein
MQATDRGVLISIDNKSMLFNDITYQQMLKGQDKYVEGHYIQNAFNFLNPDQREFLMSGLLPEEFDDLTKHLEDNFDYTYFS